MKSLLILALALLNICPSALAQNKVTSVKPPLAEDLRKAYKEGDYTKAIKIADGILVKKPGDQQVLVIKALSFGMLGNKEEARKAADALYPHSPDTEGIFLATLPLNLSREVLKRDGAWYVAEGHKLAPASPVIYMIEASEYADDSLWDKSKTAALAGVKLLSDKDALSMKTQYATIMHISGAKDEGYKLANSLLAVSPRDSLLQIARYGMLLRDKKKDEALAALNKLIAQYPAAKALFKERAFLYEDLNRHGDACGDALMLANDDDSYFPLLRKLGCPQAFANLSPAGLKAYIYDVDYHGKKYSFSVYPKSVAMGEAVRFDWKMSIRDDMQGSVNISKAALDTAHGQMNKFSGGNSELSELTSVWVSNAVYKELKRDGKSTISAGDYGFKSFAVVVDDGNDEATITNPAGRTKALKNLHIRSEDGAEELWINDDAVNPIITRMSLGWSIELKSVE